MKVFLPILLAVIFTAISYHALFAQDPTVPSANLGLSNLHAGKVRPPGWYYTQFLQTYQASEKINAAGQAEPSGGSGSIVALQQLVFISKSTFLSGHAGATLISTLVKSVPEEPGTETLTVNPSAFGDIIAGPFLQWYDKHLFNMPFSHRIGLLAGFPTGAYSSRYAINPGTRYFRIYPNYQFSINPSKLFSVSIKNNVYFYFNQTGKKSHPGIVYNLNYALEFSITQQLVFETAGYYLGQFTEDAYQGDQRYYQNKYGLSTTKERVVALGPGIGYLTQSGFSIEAKTMWETAARNRTQGLRSTLVMTYKL